MASNIYTRDTIDGPITYQRKGTQGRKPKDKELLMLRKNISISRAGQRVIEEKARAMNMSFSEYLELAGILYTLEFVNT